MNRFANDTSRSAGRLKIKLPIQMMTQLIIDEKVYQLKFTAVRASSVWQKCSQCVLNIF